MIVITNPITTHILVLLAAAAHDSNLCCDPVDRSPPLAAAAALPVGASVTLSLSHTPGPRRKPGAASYTLTRLSLSLSHTCAHLGSLSRGRHTLARASDRRQASTPWGTTAPPPPPFSGDRCTPPGANI